MKNKKQIAIVGIIILIIALLVPTISKANVEIKPDGTFWSQITISDAYETCMSMGEGATTLGNHKGLQPHLALNKDWGAVAYLALSVYGTTRSKTGEKTLDQKYYSTTTNMSGVMNFGANPSKSSAYTWTSSIIAGTTGDATNPEYRTNLTEALKDTSKSKYVESLDQTANTNKDNSKGMALAETSGWYDSSTSWSISYPCFARYGGVCGFGIGYFNSFGRCERKCYF